MALPGETISSAYPATARRFRLLISPDTVPRSRSFINPAAGPRTRVTRSQVGCMSHGWSGRVSIATCYGSTTQVDWARMMSVPSNRCRCRAFTTMPPDGVLVCSLSNNVPMPAILIPVFGLGVMLSNV